MADRGIQKPVASSAATYATMSANRSRNTGPELRLRVLLRNAGYPGYRLHWRKAPGHPDVAYPGRRVAIFVNGCFWHRCPHCNPSHPAANYGFWAEKFAATKERDARNVALLEAAGWTVLTIWECVLRESPDAVIADIVSVLRTAATRSGSVGAV